LADLANWVLDYFLKADALHAAFWLFIQNVLQFVICLAVGQLLVVVFARRRTIDTPLPLERREVLLALSVVFLNTMVAVAGWYLWRAGVIKINRDLGIWTFFDVVLLLVAMDFLMYVTHRICHHPKLFPIVHQTHHIYDRPRPLSLFVLNPVEVFGFGSLWLLVLVAHSWSWMAICLYLFLNAAFGTLGHLGVEPFPRFWTKIPVIGRLTTSTFHGQHHQVKDFNFGFYTDIWDRMFDTLHKAYGVEPVEL
jgi:sterol desaturase/sphingolipid hydroxylase (fatty acid hydroxylase superfamily)